METLLTILIIALIAALFFLVLAAIICIGAILYFSESDDELSSLETKI